MQFVVKTCISSSGINGIVHFVLQAEPGLEQRNGLVPVLEALGGDVVGDTDVVVEDEIRSLPFEDSVFDLLDLCFHIYCLLLDFVLQVC